MISSGTSSGQSKGHGCGQGPSLLTSLVEELQVAVAEHPEELLESSLPDIFLLASSRAVATSILPSYLPLLTVVSSLWQ